MYISGAGFRLRLVKLLLCNTSIPFWSADWSMAVQLWPQFPANVPEQLTGDGQASWALVNPVEDLEGIPGLQT